MLSQTIAELGHQLIGLLGSLAVFKCFVHCRTYFIFCLCNQFFSISCDGFWFVIVSDIIGF